MLGESQSLRSTLLSRSMLREGSLSSLPVKSLLTPRRADLAVKFRYFRHLSFGNDTDSERVYRWHIEARSGQRMKAGLNTDRWKRSVENYVRAAKALHKSIARDGVQCAVPVDPNGELLDGSHRVACAVALGIERITVERNTRMVWAPAWDENWFVANGVSDHDLARIKADCELMKQ